MEIIMPIEYRLTNLDTNLSKLVNLLFVKGKCANRRHQPDTISGYH